MIVGLLQRTYKTLHAIVFPPKCLVCGRFIPVGTWRSAAAATIVNTPPWLRSLPLEHQLDRLLSVCLCQDCTGELVAVEAPICDCCGFPFESRQGTDHRCGDCITNKKYFRIARAPLVYEQVLMRIIHRFKYNGKLQLANPLGELLLTAYGLFWEQDAFDMILPVPLHISRFRNRGFNQAHLLVCNWPKVAGRNPLSATGGHQVVRDLLTRSRQTQPQSSLGRQQRAANIKNAFGLCDPDKVADKCILLVDDVYTTGATVNECARLLVDNGAESVDVLTLARAI